MFDHGIALAKQEKKKYDENAKQNKAKKTAKAKEDKAFNDKYIDYGAVDPSPSMFDNMVDWVKDKFVEKEPWQVGYKGKR